MDENGKETQRSFWTKSSAKEQNVLEIDFGQAQNPFFAGERCAYADLRDKPPRVQKRTFCPHRYGKNGNGTH